MSEIPNFFTFYYISKLPSRKCLEILKYLLTAKIFNELKLGNIFYPLF